VKLETHDFKFKFAFGVKDANSNKVLDDESLISWAPYLTTVTSVGDVLKEKYTPLAYRKCTD
jgi:hypothetical protein